MFNKSKKIKSKLYFFLIFVSQDVHKMTLADYEAKYGAPADDDLDDIAAEEQPGDLSDIAEPEPQEEMWQQPVKVQIKKFDD